MTWHWHFPTHNNIFVWRFDGAMVVNLFWQQWEAVMHYFPTNKSTMPSCYPLVVVVVVIIIIGGNLM